MNETINISEPAFSLSEIDARLDALEIGIYALMAALCATAPEAQAHLRQYL